jgi:tetratricopeptide (TPR) repeat protein
MTDADKKVDQFISTLETEFKDIPEAIVKEGAQSVLDYLKGKKTLAQMFNVTPEMLRFMVEQGFNQFKTGRYEDAERIFKVLTFLDWNNAYMHSMHGSILQQQKKYGEAVAEYSEAVKLNPKDIVSLVNRAEIFLIYGHIPFAQHDLDQALTCTDIGEPKWVERAKSMKDRITNALSSAKTSESGDVGGKTPVKKGKKGAK